MAKKLVLNQKEKKVTGLSAGLADYFELDVAIVRVGMLAAIILTGVVPGLIFYLIASAITPKGPGSESKKEGQDAEKN